MARRDAPAPGAALSAPGPSTAGAAGPDAPSAGPVVGVDIGGTKILALVDGEPGVVHRVATPSRPADLLEAVRSVVDAAAGGVAPVAVGAGFPGLVDGSGTVRFSAHLPGLVGTRLAAELAAAYGEEVWVGNDATAAAWAELRRGAGRGSSELVMVTLGTGIGGGIVAGGRLLEGARRFAGEWGHMVVDPHGPPCPCGQRGCWERFASGDGLGRLGREAAQAGRAPTLVALAGGDPEAVRGEHVTAAATAGDPGSREVLAELAWWLALGLANLANALDPEVMVIGGGLVAAGEVLFVPLREAFGQLVEAGSQRDVRIVPAALGPSAGAVGAALLAGSGS